VVGLLAGRVRERVHRPVIAFADGNNGELKGSARSIPGLHIRDALDAVAARHPDLIGRFIREASACFYASRAWVDQHGHPRTAEQAAEHHFIGSDRSGRYLGYLRQHGLPLQASNFSCYAENTMANWALVRQGLGIGAMMDDIAGTMPDVLRVLDDVAPVMFPIWLVTHRELRTARRIRLVFDLLAEALAAQPLAAQPLAASAPDPGRWPH